MKIKQYFSARYPFLWLTTTEEERTIRAHRNELTDTKRGPIRVFVWDIAKGFSELAKNGDQMWTWKRLQNDDSAKLNSTVPGFPTEPTTNPGLAIEQLLLLPENSVIYCKDFHKYFTDITVVRRALNVKEILKATARLVCFLSCESSSAIPPELRNDVVPYTPPFPTKEELVQTVKRVAADNGIENIDDKDVDLYANALIGLTEEAAENSLALCLVQHKRFDVKVLNREKARLIESIAGLTYAEYNETLEDLAGYDVVINYILRAAPNPLASAILLYGVPGAGKSHCAKGSGNALGWPVIGFNPNNIRTKYQGETEAALERALGTIEAVGRCIVFADEIDKGIAGSQGGADADAGTGSRIIGRLLSYFQDRKPGGAYWIMTANNLQDILTISGGALVRRFDAMFFLDMPNPQERKQIIKIWNRKMDVDIPEDYDTEGMTGADIAKLARTMKLLNCGIDEARKYVIPTRQALGARIEEIRKAAQSTCIPASSREELPAAPAGRKIDL